MFPCMSKYLFVFVLRFYSPVNPMGSCQLRSVYLTTHLLGRLSPLSQGSGNSEIWIGPADDDDVINEPISKKKYNITCHENEWQLAVL